MADQGGRWPESGKPRCARPGCIAFPVKGTTVCSAHGGLAPQVRRKAVVRVELADWGVTDEHVDPGEQLLRLVAQSSRRAAFYASLLQRSWEGDPDLPSAFTSAGLGALIGHRYLLTKDGDPVPVEEAIRGLVELEAAERERCARWSKMAIEAGLEARRVQLAEQEAATLHRAVVAALEAHGLGDRAAELLPAIATRLDVA